MLYQCICANFKMVSFEIILICIMSALLVLSFTDLLLLFMLWLWTIIIVLATFRMYKKLFYTSVYGETAIFYQSFPISAAETVTAKLITVAVSNILSFAAFAGTFVIIDLFFEGAITEDMTEMFKNVLTGNTVGGPGAAAITTVTFLSTMVIVFLQPALVFLTVADYNSARGEKKKGSRRLTIASALVVNGLIVNFSTLLEVLGVKNMIIGNSCGIILGIAALAAFYRQIVKLLDEQYELN